MELTGNVVSVLPSQTFNGRNGEVVRYGFVLETNGQYPKKVAFTVLGTEKWERMSSILVVGNAVQVFFDVSSREWQGKWYSSIDAFRVSPLVTVQQTQSVSSPVVQPQSVQQSSGGDDVLPF